MKLLKSVLVLTGMVFLASCSDEPKEEPSVDCSKSPKLTKSCLEGSWLMNKEVVPQMITFKALDERLAGASISPDLSYNNYSFELQFSVDASTRNTPSKSENLKLLVSNGVVGECNPCLFTGTYSISADSTSLLINLSSNEIDNKIAGNYEVRVYGDSLGHAITWPVAEIEEKIIFSGILPKTIGKVAEIFYRSIP